VRPAVPDGKPEPMADARFEIVDRGSVRRATARVRARLAVVASPAGPRSADDVAAYWTPGRLRRARPMLKELPGSAPPRDAPERNDGAPPPDIDSG
jgi:hypothetical protein